MVKEKEETTKKKVPVKKRVVKKKEETAKEEKEIIIPEKTGSEYYEGTGRRKTSIARVRLYNKKNGLVNINGKKLEEYFSTETLQKTVISPLDKMKSMDRFEIKVLVKGGGINSQAEAIRHGIARALVVFNLEYKKRLRKAGLLTRDSRMKERKKFGLKRARRAPQWSKR
ncbi:MAG TPA: 30S ribosomal protein S9 [Candidatus Pacearchaeota archaeon]|nr:30S ribosomal protein S9 [Candidatus Parcubacteria bacterium]HOC53824.1 30S ribosomal protein S9 [Candidatus Pacearchaeota archaeon]HQM24558.1 30S ribosomal protein S9 [Candidatus Pacearchaeota archaeon]